MIGDDWQPGDLALCVNAQPGDTYGHPPQLRVGALYTVWRYFPGVSRHSVFGFDGGGLVVHGAVSRSPDGFAAKRFRKIRPHTPDAEDAETIRLLNGKPVKQPA